MRTTVRLPDELLEAAERRAVETGCTLAEVIEDALRAFLEDVPPPPGPLFLPTFGSEGTQLGVNLDDRAALLDRMERRE